MLRGVVKKKLLDKNFGFIRSEDGVEYFFHQSACAKGQFESLTEGTEVEFDPQETSKGPRAEIVRKV